MPARVGRLVVVLGLVGRAAGLAVSGVLDLALGLVCPCQRVGLAARQLGLAGVEGVDLGPLGAREAERGHVFPLRTAKMLHPVY